MDKVTSSGGFKYLTLDDAFFVFTSLYDIQEPELLRPLCTLLSSQFNTHSEGIAVAFAMYGDIFNKSDR